MLKAIGDRLSIVYSELIQMTPAEIQKSLSSGGNVVQREELISRGRLFGFFFCNGRHWVETEEHLREEPVQAQESQVKMLHGMTVREGVVRGSVCVVRGRQDLPKLHPSSIIVAPMTTNDWTFAIKKNAVAIVTDEGGITSHAAIISRELGIPCIVGVGNATEVFHDEDIVEVMARGSSGTISRIV